MEYPLSAELGLKPIRVVLSRSYRDGQFVEDAIEHPGFDFDDVQKALGKRFETFQKSVQVVFVCLHRNWPADHPEKAKRNTEVHCFRCEDVEQFLRGGR